MRKITLKEFFESDETLVIHCDTEENANTLLKAFDKLGKKWSSVKSYLENNYWRYYKEETCYTNEGTYNDKEWCLDNNYKIYEFDDVIFEEEENKMNDKVNKVFELLEIQPNEKFKIKFESGCISDLIFHFDETLYLKCEDDCDLNSNALLFQLINGDCKIIKSFSTVGAKTIRDLTDEDFKKFKRNYCARLNCKGCPFVRVNCTIGDAKCWINNKELYSDNFLNQEVRIGEKNENE